MELFFFSRFLSGLLPRSPTEPVCNVDPLIQWKWSSFRAYFYGEPGLVRVNFQEWRLRSNLVRLRSLEVREGTATHSSMHGSFDAESSSSRRTALLRMTKAR